MGKFKIIPIFVPHRGCPHQCSFCNQKHITGQQEEMTPDKARQRIELYLSTMDPSKHHIEIAFYGGSFTAIEREAQLALLEVAREYKENGRVHGIRLSTRPDCISKEILDYLWEYGVTEIELGVQSMAEDVLTHNRRGHTPEDVRQAVEVIRRYPIKLGLQMMTGLMGDTPEKSRDTAEKLAGLKPDFVRIYPTLVLDNTPLAQAYREGTYQPATLQDTVELCRELLSVFEQHDIPVIRLGLLLSDQEVHSHLLAGPYHPRLRELVQEK